MRGEIGSLDLGRASIFGCSAGMDGLGTKVDVLLQFFLKYYDLAVRTHRFVAWTKVIYMLLKNMLVLEQWKRLIRDNNVLHNPAP